MIFSFRGPFNLHTKYLSFIRKDVLYKFVFLWTIGECCCWLEVRNVSIASVL